MRFNGSEPSFASAYRVCRAMGAMNDMTRHSIIDQLKEVETETRTQQELDHQLESGLQYRIRQDHVNGALDSILYQKLPAEIRQQIFTHMVQAEHSIHVFPPKGNENHGFRLSLCEEASYDFDLGTCRCDDSRSGRTIRSEFFNNALFLVSQTVRREALDAFFMQNHFTFTCLYDLVRFSTMFSASCAKIQQLRLLERVDDYPSSEYRLEGIQNARLRMQNLKHLDLHIFFTNWSTYEELYEDGLVDQLIHFALGPPVKSPTSKKRRSYWLKDDSDTEEEENENKKVKLNDDKTPFENTPVRSLEGLNKSSPASLSSSLRAARLKVAALRGCLDEDFDLTTVPLPAKSTAKLFGNHDSSRSEVKVNVSPFQIPPLRTFKAKIRMRSHYLSYRARTADGTTKQAYYDALYQRLTNHLTDVFMDAGKKYRNIDDVPKLGDKPKQKVREEDVPLRGSEKRGILFMRD